MLGADIERLRSLTGVKWTQDEADVIPAWVADMDFAPAPVIVDAVRELVDRGDFGYNAAARNELIPAWSDWQERHFGWRPPEDECRIVTSTLNALAMVLEFMTRPGDGVAFFTPIYHPFRNITVESGRRAVDVPLEEGTWRLDAERFAAAVDPDTKLVLFANPHNPLGRMFDHDELAGFAEVCVEHDLVIVSDEIWCDLTHRDGHLPLWHHFPELRERCVTLGSASKSFSLAGLRTAVVHIGDPGIRAQLEALPPHFVGSPSSPGAAATLAAWRHGQPWLDTIKAQLTANRDHLLTRVEQDLSGVRMHAPEATYLAWLDFTETSLAGDPAAGLLEHGRLALHGGEKFAPSATAFARMNFATSPAILDEMIDRIATALDSA